MISMAIDPGPERSAWLVHDSETDEVRGFAIWDNSRLLDLLRSGFLSADVTCVVIEKVESFGMAVGAEVFETVFWSGRFAEAAHPRRVERIGRKEIKRHICGTHQAKDPNIRQALLDRYGGAAAKGIKKAPGPLYGVSGDVWSALAVAVTFGDRLAEPVGSRSNA